MNGDSAAARIAIAGVLIFSVAAILTGSWVYVAILAVLALACRPLEAEAAMSGNWREQAACRDRDPALFVPDEDTSLRARRKRETRAKAICAGWPVTRPCLEFALASGTAHGIWGGLNEAERKALGAGQDRPRLCGSGLHEMTPENTYTFPNGWKACRACREAGNQRREPRRHDGKQPGSRAA